MNIDILLDSGASDSEVAAVMDVAREEGINGSVEATLSGRSSGEFPWTIILLASIGSFFSAFFAAVGTGAGRDAYQGIRRLTARLFGARRNLNGSVVLSDDNTRTHIVLIADLPEEAYRQLAQKGLGQLLGGYWTWNPDLKEWKRL